MSADDKWIIAGIAATVLLGYYGLVIRGYGIAAGLYGNDKVSIRVWRASTGVFAFLLFIPVIVVGWFFVYSRGLLTGLLLAVVLTGVGTILFWQRRRMAAVGRHLWPPLVMFGALILVAVAVVRTSDPLVIILAATTPLFAWYLLRDRLALSLATGTSALAAIPGRLARASQHPPWTYDFIEHLSDESTKRREGRGSVVKKVRKAESGTVLAEAIFEHPPANDDTVIQFSVVGVAEHVRRLRLEGNYGILARFEDDDGQLKTSKFPVRTGNKVRFEVRINQRWILQDERDDYGWIAIESAEPLIPDKGRLLVELRTNCLGDPSWNWAAWGELKLVEWKHHVT